MDNSTCKYSLDVNKEGKKYMRLFEIIMLVIVALWALPAMAQDVDPGYGGDSTVVDANTPDEQAFDDLVDGDVDPGTGDGGGTVGDGGGTTDPGAGGDTDGDDGGTGGGKDKVRKRNFGAIVSAEAHRLKAAGASKKGFGSWVKNHPENPSNVAGSAKPSSSGSGSARKPGKKPK
jgi:hypothetical protein